MADDIKITEVLQSLIPNYKDMEVNHKTFTVVDWGENTPLSDEDIEAERARLQTEFDNNLTKQATDKVSANTKLKALGLTDDEIKAIKGIR